MATNAINWFEIPVSNLERATKFYTNILGSKFEPMEAMGLRMASFPMERGGVGGSLVQGDGYAPTTEGVRVYLNGGEDLNTVLRKVEAAGGKIAQPKTSIGENGFLAFFIDTEGNRVGLHSMH
jgi:predicted enzyme related to lactoylglutathione lyase